MRQADEPVEMKHYHPNYNDQGDLVELKVPSRPTPMTCWTDPSQIATVIPSGEVPEVLNGIELRIWTAPFDSAGWEAKAGLDADRFTEPPMISAPGKSAASGAVVLENDGRVWVVSPSNMFGGYVNTFPKGKLDSGLSLRANALKECYEETGLQVALTGFLCDSVRSTSLTRYYTARRLAGHPGSMGWETQAVHLVPRPQLAHFVSHPNDLGVLQALQALEDLG